MRLIVIPIACISVLFPRSISSSQIAPDQEWANPAYVAQSSQEHKVSITYRYTYEERIFTPPLVVESLAANARTFMSPESTMIARASAMKELDYAGWLATWDQPSQLQMEQRAKQAGLKLSDVVDQWRGILKAGQIMMVRRIQTGQFVILTYRIVDSSRRDIGQLELPSVFHLVGDQWLGTQELSTDELLLESPWITGTQHIERTAK